MVKLKSVLELLMVLSIFGIFLMLVAYYGNLIVEHDQATASHKHELMEKKIQANEKRIVGLRNVNALLQRRVDGLEDAVREMRDD